ncbi:transposase, partial [Sporotomaculum syntrophicum]
SKNWTKIYNKRTSVERCFGRLKEYLSLKNLNVRGFKKVKARVLLSCIAMLSTAMVSVFEPKVVKQVA